MAPSNEIVLLTTPTTALMRMGIKSRLDFIAHWALCINGRCYELAKRDDKKHPFHFESGPEQEWRQRRASERKAVEERFIGHMAAPYSDGFIDEVAGLVWKRSLREKYAFDERNCQVFIHLLVELIGDKVAKAQIPVTVDKLISEFESGWNTGLVGVTISTVAIAAAHVDPTGISLGLAMLMAISQHDAKVKAGQKEIRKQMKKSGRPLVK